MVWYRIQAIQLRIWSKHRPRLKRASSSAEKDLIRKEMNLEMQRALEAEGLHQADRDPHTLYWQGGGH